MAVRLGGVVTPGFGLATSSLAPIMETLREKSGLPLVEGTLNVRLDAAYVVIPDLVLEAREHDHHETLLVQRCQISHLDGLIVRTSTQARGESHPLDVVEVLAVAKLRETLDLSDGSRVEIVVARSIS